MKDYVKGYEADAGVDIILDKDLVIRPGFNKVELSAKYTPGPNEVAFLVPRGSTAAKGIFPIMVAIDTGFNGELTGFIVNCTNFTYEFSKGTRAFGIVNLKLAETRVEYDVIKPGMTSGSNKLASSGGQNE